MYTYVQIKNLEIMCQINGDCLRVEIGWDGNIKNFPYSTLYFSILSLFNVL